MNPAVRCINKVGFAVAKTKVLTLLGGDHSLTPVLKAIEDGCLGEGNVIREFFSYTEGEKHKQRAFTFRRTAIPSYLRKRLDDGGYREQANRLFSKVSIVK